jgi:Acyltransferase family
MKNSDTQFLRALGMILIINSHLDLYYPIPYIGTGGALGNSIFFCLSAFGIYLSQQKNSKPFSEWFHGRMSRIYPSMWIVLIFLQIPVMLILGYFNNAEYIFTFIGKFFNPPFWFLQALLVYYVLSFFLLKADQRNKLFCLFGALSILYFALYFSWLDLSKWIVEDHPIKLIHYFMIFLFGIYLAIKNKSITYTGLHNYFVLIFLVAVVYGHKFLMTKGIYPELQFIQQAAMYPFVFYLLKISRSPFVSSMLGKSKVFSSIVNFIANHSLELYIIQETFVYPLTKLNLPFPLNAIIFISLTFIFSAIVNRLAGIMRKKIS